MNLVIVDTPPAITIAISNVIAHADLVLIPTRPSPHDLRAVGATVDIAERQGKPVVFVMNGATPRARITAEAAVALSQHGTVAPVTVHQRVDFAASMVDGRTVGEVVPECASAKEIRALWAYVQDRLSRVRPDIGARPPSHTPELHLHSLQLLETTQHGVAADFEETLPEPMACETTTVERAPPRAPGHVQTDVPASDADSERRSGAERRKPAPFFKPFGSTERRVHPFGRRSSDRSVTVAGAGK